MTIRNVIMAGAVLAGIAAWEAPATAASANNSTIPPLFAVLLAGNEVSPKGNANAGDPNGRGSATVIIDETKLCFAIAVSGIGKPTLAHIHQGAAGVNGRVVVTLVPPTTGNPGTSSGCVSVSDKGLLAQIQSRPAAFYVNVHTDQFKDGAVRGQLF